MKYLCFYILLLFFLNSNAQETLQTVTDRGKMTNQEIQFRSGSVSDKYVFVGGSPGYARIGAYDINNGFDNLVVEAQRLGLGVINPSEKFEVDGFIKSGNISIGHNNFLRSSPLNYVTLGSDNHGTMLVGSNLQVSNDANLKIAMSHPTMSGAGIIIPGNMMNLQNSIQFHTTPPAMVTTGSNYASLKMILTAAGDLGIGTATPKEKLSVNGKIRAHEVKVETANWPDYVFEEGYKYKSLREIDEFIKLNKHLPEVPSAKEVAQNGIELGEMNKILLKKIEEMTLYMIELKKENMEVRHELSKIQAIIKSIAKNKK